MFAPNEIVNIYSSGLGSPVLATAAADASGAFTVSAQVPQSTFGPRVFLGLGQDSRLLGAARFGVNSRLTLNPQSGSAGSSFVVQGFGFYPFWGLKISWGKSVLLGTASTDRYDTFAGAAAITATVPQGSQPGVYEIEATFSDGRVWAKASFTVN